MKHLAITISLLILIASGCDLNTTTKENIYYTIPNSQIEISTPSNWHQNPKDNPFDLQLFSDNEELNTGIFLFYKDDLAEETTPKDILNLQIEDLKSKRENFKVKEKESTEVINEKRYTTTIYSGEKTFLKYYYKYTLIEFINDPEFFLVVLQVSRPSNWEKASPILDNIIKSANMISD